MLLNEEAHYSLSVHGNRILLCDDEANEVDYRDAKRIARLIIQTYRPRSYVYIGKVFGEERYKVGFSKNPARRANELGVYLAHTIACDSVGKYSGPNTERLLHFLLKKQRRHLEGEWFRLDQTSIDFLMMLRTARDVRKFVALYQGDKVSRERLRMKLDAFELHSFEYHQWIESFMSRWDGSYPLGTILDYLLEDYRHYQTLDVDTIVEHTDKWTQRLLKLYVGEHAAKFWSACINNIEIRDVELIKQVGHYD